MKQTTLCLIVNKDQILLAHKKRGFGAEKWNGYGGKPKNGEDLISCAVREMEEEIGVKADPKDLQKLGRMEFILMVILIGIRKLIYLKF